MVAIQRKLQPAVTLDKAHAIRHIMVQQMICVAEHFKVRSIVYFNCIWFRHAKHLLQTNANTKTTRQMERSKREKNAANAVTIFHTEQKNVLRKEKRATIVEK